MKYLVISFEDQISLTEKVNLLISQGWKPKGGVSVGAYTYTTQYREPGWSGSETQQHTGAIYAQAMIHEGVE